MINFFLQYNTHPQFFNSPFFSRFRRFITASNDYKHRIAMLMTIMLAVLFAANTAYGQDNNPTTIRGEIDVLLVENFADGTAKYAYFLRVSDGKKFYRLQFRPTAPAALRTGQRVTVKGHASGRDLRVNRLEVDSPPPLENMATDERRAVVLMVDLLDKKASSRYTLAQVAEAMYTGSRSVSELYQTASHGQFSFLADSDGDNAPDVFGPFEIPFDSTDCDYYTWAYAAESAATTSGVDLSLYRHRVFVLPRYNELACSWAGIANVGCGSYCRAWIAEGESPMVYAHELGHNLDMAHAGTDPENDGQMNSTYGDHSDPMGSSRRWHLFNGPHADQMGWYDAFPGSLVTVTASGTYHLAVLGTDPAYATEPQILKIKKADSGDYYYLTYRQPRGYDDTLSSSYTQGVNIHRYRGSGYSYTYFITALTDAGTFSDSANQIAIRQISHSPDYVTITVDLGEECSAEMPTVSMTPASTLVTPGAVSSYTFNVTNNDGTTCGSTLFSLGYTGQPQAVLSTDYLTLSSGQSDSVTLQVDTALLADGDYPLEVQVSDNDGANPSHATVTGQATVTVDGTPPSVPTGLEATENAGSQVRLNWTAANDAGSGVAGYIVYRDGAVLGQTISPNFLDDNTQAGMTYYYTVMAEDGAANASAHSNEAVITVSGGGGATTIAIADLDAVAEHQARNRWSASVTITVLDSDQEPVADAQVTGNWNAKHTDVPTCWTDSAGRCSLTSRQLHKRMSSVQFSVSTVDHDTLVYDAGANTDADGDSDGTRIMVYKP